MTVVTKPRLGLPSDLTLRLLRDGYAAIARDRKDHGGGDPYVTRLLGRRTVVVRGPGGAEAFYDESLVRRRGAIPAPLRLLLFGHGAVHGLDDTDHRVRKLLMLDLLDPDGLDPLVHEVARRVDAAVEHAVAGSGELAVFDTLVDCYGPAVLGWAGLPLPEDEAVGVSRRLAAIVDGFGLAGRAYLRAWRDRLWADRWARRIVADVRHGRRRPPPGSVLARLARTDLSDRVAGVELLNVLRPTVAVAWPGTFAAGALATHPELAARVAEDGPYRRGFAHEVRRTALFVPALAGRVRRAGTVGGVAVHPGDRIVLDVVGTDLDARVWQAPADFRPERFGGRDPEANAMVPQGGGLPEGHRCPGEPLTVRMLEATLGVLARRRWLLVSDTQIDLARIPTLPVGGLRIRASAGLSS